MTWRGAFLAAAAALLGAGGSPAVAGGSVAGAWEGSLPIADPPIVVRVEIEGGAEPTASIVSTSHPVLELTVFDIRIEEGSLTFHMAGFPRNVWFEGRLSDEGKELEGSLLHSPPVVPATDIHLLQVDASKVPWTIVAASNATDRDGYDNQPHFTSDGKAFLYTSIREGQADIYRYDVTRGASVRLTRTSETAEYSPTPLPGGGGFSSVRVEKDGTQRLWAFDDDGGAPRILLENVKPVGYHAWLDETTLALFVLGTPNTLQIASIVTGESEPRLESIGRSLHRAPRGGRVTFLHKRSETDWRIMELAPDRGPAMEIAPAVEGSEDFTYLPDGSILTGDGSVLRTFARGTDTWVEVANLADHGITGVTRLSASPDGKLLAVVGDRPGGAPPEPTRLPLTFRRVDDGAQQSAVRPRPGS